EAQLTSGRLNCDCKRLHNRRAAQRRRTNADEEAHAMTDATAAASAAFHAESGNPVVTEPVEGSDRPVQLIQVEMRDGLYAPIGLRVPAGPGPFPLVLFTSGNGGGGLRLIRDFTHNQSWTQERFLDAGYAVAWTRYRAEVDYAYDRVGPLVEDIRQGRQLLN